MITKKKMPWSFIKFSLLIFKGNAWGSVWRICTLVLGVKELCFVNYSCHMWLSDNSRRTLTISGRLFNCWQWWLFTCGCCRKFRSERITNKKIWEFMKFSLEIFIKYSIIKMWHNSIRYIYSFKLKIFILKE